MITTNTTKNTAIGRGRTRQAGCSVNIHAIQAALSPHRVRSMRSEPTAECLDDHGDDGQDGQQHVRPDGHHRKHPPLRHFHPGKRHRLAHVHPPESIYSQRNHRAAASPNATA